MNKKKVVKRILSGFMCTAIALSGIINEKPQTARADTVASVISVSAGSLHTAILRSDGTVVSWGHNSYGELGDGTNNDSNTPVRVKDLNGNILTGITAVSAGRYYTAALRSDGTVWSWGCNYDGQLGDGTNNDSNTPVRVKDLNGNILTGITAISAGSGHTAALKKDGTVWSWGYNNDGQLGDGANYMCNEAVQLKDSSGQALADVAAVSVAESQTVALKSDGTVWSCGCNNNGQLGDGTNNDRNEAVQVKDSSGQALTDVTAVSAGALHTVALKKDGTVWSWGLNYYGELGDGTNADKNEAVQAKDSVTGQALAYVAAVSAGGLHTVALKSDGTVWSWGWNNNGQLGDGTTSGKDEAVQVKDSSGQVLTDIKAVSAGGYHTVALKSDGTVWSWGWNNYGQLGDGTINSSSFPVKTQLLTNDEAVDTDKQALAIGYAGIDNASSVTQDITLPTIGANGTSISWASDNAAITSAGLVIRPDYFDKNTSVILTATITKGKSTETKTFNLTVIRNAITDQESVDTDQQALAIGYAGIDNANSVTQNITLPLTGANGTSISWASDNAAITSAGLVIRPDYFTGDAAVALTATITKGTGTDTKTFNLTVIKNAITDQESVDTDKQALVIGYGGLDNPNSVTQNVTLPISGANGTSISWASDNAAITSAGLVIRPDYFTGDASVTLTATITKGASTDTKIFNLTVIKNAITDQESIDTDKGTLAIGYSGLDNASSVTQNIILPLSGVNGTSISWASDNAAITSAGLVIRPDYFAGNAAVTLTATITKGSSKENKTFNLTVIKNAITDQESVDTESKALAIGYANGDSESSVTQDITLPTSGANGTSISWTSDNTAISCKGTITRPDSAKGDTKVTLTAEVTKGDAKAAIKYVVTVKAMPEAAATKSNTTALPITGSPLNFDTLEISGLLLIIIGAVLIKRKKKKITK